MQPDALQRAATELLRASADTPPREAGEPLRWQDKARIVALRDEGRTQRKSPMKSAVISPP